MNKTKIAWATYTHNFWSGCNKISAGCKNCYAERLMRQNGQDFNKLHLMGDPFFSQPAQIKKPAIIFTCSMSDFFHPAADQWRDRAWEVIRKSPQHRWLILTKRIHRIWDCMPDDENRLAGEDWSHVWLGVSVEDQENADKRIPILIDAPAHHRFASAEPMLEYLHLARYLGPQKVEWVIAGGESGLHARPFSPTDASLLRAQCQRAGVPFFFKQNGGAQKVGEVYGGDRLFGEVIQEAPDFGFTPVYEQEGLL